MQTFPQFTSSENNRDLFGLMPDYLQISINFHRMSNGFISIKNPFQTFYNFLHFDTLFNFFSHIYMCHICVYVFCVFIYFSLSFIRLFFLSYIWNKYGQNVQIRTKQFIWSKIQFTQTLYYFYYFESF